MRCLLPALVLAGLAACQQSAPATQAAPPLPPVAAAPPAPPVALPDSLTPAMRDLLRHTRLAELLAPPRAAHTGGATVLDGFFGTDPQRLSLAVTQARADSLQPGRLRVAGKIRYRQQVSRFTGDIQLTTLADYYEQGLLLSQGDTVLHYVPDSTRRAGGYVSNARAYSARAAFRLHGAAPATYVLTGQLLLDFWVTSQGQTGFVGAPGQGEMLRPAPTKGSGLVLRGSWHDNPARPDRPFLVSGNVFLLAPGLIRDFGVGERSSQVNPKYARLGWATYWENDEWWVDSPKPSLNL